MESAQISDQRYGDVCSNVISVMGVGVQLKKHYITLEWPPNNTTVSLHL